MGAVKRKSIHAALAAARAEDAAPLTWIATPEWALLEPTGCAAFLWDSRQRDRMPKVTKAEYVRALERHLPEVIERDETERSWQTFRACCEERGQFAPGYAEKKRAEWAAKHAAGKQAPSGLLDELDTYGLDERHPRDRESPEVNRYEQERQRLLDIARKAPVRFFTE